MTTDAATPLVTRGDRWGLHSFGIDRAVRDDIAVVEAGMMAADDLFREFFTQVKTEVGRGGFCRGAGDSPE